MINNKRGKRYAIIIPTTSTPEEDEKTELIDDDAKKPIIAQVSKRKAKPAAYRELDRLKQRVGHGNVSAEVQAGGDGTEVAL